MKECVFGGDRLNNIAWLIIACEIGFWVMIVLGLLFRYVWKKQKIGLLFLALTPVVDVVLLAATSLDLYRGAIATIFHAIAAVYVGVSIGFGKSMIQWADDKFLYHVMKKGTKPVKRSGMDNAIHYVKGLGKHVLSYGVGAGLLAAVIFLIDDPSRTKAMSDVWKVWTFILMIDFLIAASYFVWPKKAKV